jgi:hypothetical protein
MRSMIASLLISLFVLACTEPADEPSPELSVEPTPTELAAPSAPASPAGDVGALQVCTSDCLYPYDGNPISCTSSGDCNATPSSVICNGVTKTCRRLPPTTCAMNPAWSCTTTRQCDTLCGGPGSGRCITSTACCVCL